MRSAKPASGFPEAPEAVALALFLEIEAAEERVGRRDRHDGRSERERLIALYRECLAAVIGDDLVNATTRH